MSVRAPPEHVWVRGTMVSTDRHRPSVLTTAALQSLGLPNSAGTLVVDGVTLNVRFCRNDDSRIYVYATPTESYCAVS